MIDFNFKSASSQVFNRSLDALRDQLLGETEDSADRVADMVLDTSKNNAPIEDGDLRNSGRVVKGRTRRKDVIIRKIRFGGRRAPHAAIVHWDPNARHDIGGDRYLQRALDQHRRDLFNVVATRWRTKL